MQSGSLSKVITKAIWLENLSSKIKQGHRTAHLGTSGFKYPWVILKCRLWSITFKTIQKM